MRILFYVLLLLCANRAHAQTTDNTCEICERVASFDGLVTQLSSKHWQGFDDDRYQVPLFYFTPSHTYMAFPNKKLRKHFKATQVKCNNGVALYKLDERLDSIPFHMSNQTNIDKKSSPYYKNPVMFCSDAATAHKLIPDITHTEEWTAIVMHEYFHGFQLKHAAMMSYLADSIKMSADTLINLYRSKQWFKDALAQENEVLLRAIGTGSADSLKLLSQQFLQLRATRHKRFKAEMGYDIARYEDFWEKMEGPARYVEYHLSYIYQSTEPPAMKCDTLFNNYKTYKHVGFENMAWMHDKTTIMPAYYYVTGFNMCRLLDRLYVSYKADLFNNHISLRELVLQSVSQATVR